MTFGAEGLQLRARNQIFKLKKINITNNSTKKINTKTNMTLFISYDFTNDKVRSQFSKFLTKYGRRIQYSVYEITNSQRYSDKVMAEINSKYRPMFSATDSIWVWEMTDNDAENRIHKYGYAENENRNVVFL